MSGPALPDRLLQVLPGDTARSWLMLLDIIPPQMVLYGGTAIAAHLFHRVSRDLDFFFHGEADLAVALARLRDRRTTAVQTHTPDTLNVLFGETKIQFLLASGQRPLQPATNIAGLPVASLHDLAATKIKVIGDRGELRDYFDLMTLDRQGSVSVEDAIGCYRDRYSDTTQLRHIVSALGYLDDVADDPALPVNRTDIERFWRQRQPRVVASMSQVLAAPPPGGTSRSFPI